MIQPIGYFYLWRELYSKPIWLNSTAEQKVILIALLGMANFNGKEWEWKGQKFKAEKGQFVTSIDSIVENCGKGITTQNVRSALLRFEKLEFLTNESTKTGRLITILNWDIYQPKKEKPTDESTDDQQRGNKEVTDDQQRGNKEVTPKEEIKKDKNVKNDKECNKVFDYYCEVFAGLYTRLTLTEKRKSHIKARLLEGYTVEQMQKAISNIRTSSFHCGENDKNMMYATIEFIFRNTETLEKWINHMPKKSGNANTNKAIELYEQALKEEEDAKE
jgi:hypothetical protein